MRNETLRARFNLVAVIMCGVLGVSVGLAWLTTKPQRQTVMSGAEIISQLTEKKLDAYWPPEDRLDWFIGLKEDTKPVGWRMMSRVRNSGDMFSGGLVAGTVGDRPQESSWRLKTDLSEGLYVGSEFDDKGQAVKTRILLTDDKITVVRTSSERKLTAAVARPDNYVPEGVFPLVLRLAAARRTEVSVKMIFDQSAISQGTVNFVTARLIPLGDNIIRVKYFIGGATGTTDYHLDPVSHDVYRDEYPGSGIIYRSCEEETVREIFNIPTSRPAVRAKP